MEDRAVKREGRIWNEDEDKQCFLLKLKCYEGMGAAHTTHITSFYLSYTHSHSHHRNNSHRSPRMRSISSPRRIYIFRG